MCPDGQLALLGGAARIYGGRLLFDGSSNADERALSRLRSQYGIIAL